MLARELSLVSLILALLAAAPTQSQDMVEAVRSIVVVAESSAIELAELTDEQREAGILREGVVRLPANAFADPPLPDTIKAVRIDIDTDRSLLLTEDSRGTRSDDRTFVIGTVRDQEQPTRFVFLLQRDGTPYRGEIRIRGEVINYLAPRLVDGVVELRFRATDTTVVKDGAAPVNDPSIMSAATGADGETSALNMRITADEPEDAEGGGNGNPGEPLPDENTDPHTGPPVIVDLMVVYTEAAETSATAFWHPLTMYEIIDWQVFLANVQLGVQANVKLELVHVGSVLYTESGSFREDVTRLACPCDHKLDAVGSNNLNEVFEPWKASGADVVSLWVDMPLSDYAGIAYQNWYVTPDFAPRAVSVVDWRQATTGNLSFDHEVGHSLGARHDRAQENDVSQDYNYGFINYSQKLSSIMAYASTCESFGIDCARDYTWSDSAVQPQLGIATGSHAADNARALRENALIVATHDSKHNLVGCCINYGNFLVRRWRPGPCP